MKSSGAWLRRAAAVLSALVLGGALLSARVVAEGESELTKSDAAFDRGDLREAILYARRSALLYAPGAPHVSAAYARLTAVAVGAEASGQLDIARQAWGAVRGAALETRHVVVSRSAELDRANASLARLDAAGANPGAGGAGRAQGFAAQLARDEAPRAPWVLLLGAGFALFAAGLGFVAFRGVSPAGEVSRRAVLVGGLLALAGAACWTLAVYRA